MPVRIDNGGGRSTPCVRARKAFNARVFLSERRDSETAAFIEPDCVSVGFSREEFARHGLRGRKDELLAHATVPLPLGDSHLVNRCQEIRMPFDADASIVAPLIFAYVLGW